MADYPEQRELRRGAKGKPSVLDVEKHRSSVKTERDEGRAEAIEQTDDGTTQTQTDEQSW